MSNNNVQASAGSITPAESLYAKFLQHSNGGFLECLQQLFGQSPGAQQNRRLLLLRENEGLPPTVQEIFDARAQFDVFNAADVSKFLSWLNPSDPQIQYCDDPYQVLSRSIAATANSLPGNLQQRARNLAARSTVCPLLHLHGEYNIDERVDFRSRKFETSFPLRLEILRQAVLSVPNNAKAFTAEQARVAMVAVLEGRRPTETVHPSCHSTVDAPQLEETLNNQFDTSTTSTMIAAQAGPERGSTGDPAPQLPMLLSQEEYFASCLDFFRLLELDAAHGRFDVVANLTDSDSLPTVERKPTVEWHPFLVNEPKRSFAVIVIRDAVTSSFIDAIHAEDRYYLPGRKGRSNSNIRVSHIYDDKNVNLSYSISKVEYMGTKMTAQEKRQVYLFDSIMSRQRQAIQSRFPHGDRKYLHYRCNVLQTVRGSMKEACYGSHWDTNPQNCRSMILPIDQTTPMLHGDKIPPFPPSIPYCDSLPLQREAITITHVIANVYGKATSNFKYTTLLEFHEHGDADKLIGSVPLGNNDIHIQLQGSQLVDHRVSLFPGTEGKFSGKDNREVHSGRYLLNPLTHRDEYEHSVRLCGNTQRVKGHCVHGLDSAFADLGTPTISLDRWSGLKKPEITPLHCPAETHLRGKLPNRNYPQMPTPLYLQNYNFGRHQYMAEINGTLHEQLASCSMTKILSAKPKSTLVSILTPRGGTTDVLWRLPDPSDPSGPRTVFPQPLQMFSVAAVRQEFGNSGSHRSNPPMVQDQWKANSITLWQSYKNDLPSLMYRYLELYSRREYPELHKYLQEHHLCNGSIVTYGSGGSTMMPGTFAVSLKKSKKNDAVVVLQNHQESNSRMNKTIAALYEQQRPLAVFARQTMVLDRVLCWLEEQLDGGNTCVQPHMLVSLRNLMDHEDEVVFLGHFEIRTIVNHSPREKEFIKTEDLFETFKNAPYLKYVLEALYSNEEYEEMLLVPRWRRLLVPINRELGFCTAIDQKKEKKANVVGLTKLHVHKKFATKIPDFDPTLYPGPDEEVALSSVLADNPDYDTEPMTDGECPIPAGISSAVVLFLTPTAFIPHLLSSKGTFPGLRTEQIPRHSRGHGNNTHSHFYSWSLPLFGTMLRREGEGQAPR